LRGKRSLRRLGRCPRPCQGAALDPPGGIIPPGDPPAKGDMLIFLDRGGVRELSAAPIRVVQEGSGLPLTGRPEAFSSSFPLLPRACNSAQGLGGPCSPPDMVLGRGAAAARARPGVIRPRRPFALCILSLLRNCRELGGRRRFRERFFSRTWAASRGPGSRRVCPPGPTAEMKAEGRAHPGQPRRVMGRPCRRISGVDGDPPSAFGPLGAWIR